jgi:hypothetical protein
MIDIRGRILLAKVWTLLFNPNMSGDEAGRVAAAHVAAERALERRQRREERKTRRAPDDGAPTLLNTVRRMLGGSQAGDDLPTRVDHPSQRALDPGLVRKRRNDVSAKPEPSPGVFTGSVTGAQLISDREYSPRFQDRSQWRAVIQRNAEIEAERRALWAERLASLKASGKLQ